MVVHLDLPGQPVTIDRRQVAARVGCSLTTIERLRRRGKLDSIKVGANVRYRIEDVQRLLNERRPIM
jgi:excisionase family DNA binding protein